MRTLKLDGCHVGDKQGEWTITSEPYKNDRGIWVIACHCSCGKIGEKTTNELRNKASSCWDCMNRAKSSSYVKDSKHGKWTLTENPRTVKKKLIAKCRCECGAVSDVRVDQMKLGRSEGCAECKEASHGTHGMSSTREYTVWEGIIQRCENPKAPEYKNYGGRGIKICKEWRESFEKFYSDMGSRPEGMSIDREDNDGDYEKGNCRWATLTEQARNTRKTVRLRLRGVEKSLSEWAEIYGVTRQVIYGRINRGWDVEKAIVTPRCR